MEVNRQGNATEYKIGHYYLTHTVWEDGHCEIEIHLCVPKLLWHSCDPKQLPSALERFEIMANALPLNERTQLLEEAAKPLIKEK